MIWMLKRLKNIGMKNLISLFSFVILFNSVNAQIKNEYPTVIILDEDSVVCFTISQSKQMAIWNEERKECLELQLEDKKTISELQKINNTQTVIINNLESEVALNKKTIEDKNTLLNDCEDEKSNLKKEVKKHRRGKWIAIVGGAILSVICLAV